MSGDLQFAAKQPSPVVGKDRRKIPRVGRSTSSSRSFAAHDDHDDELLLRSRPDQLPAGDEPWLRYVAAAKVIGITRGTLEVWLCTNRYAVPYYKVGRNVLFKRSELLAWLESRRRGGDAV